MAVECERRPDSLAPHELEADGVGKRELLVPEPLEPGGRRPTNQRERDVLPAVSGVFHEPADVLSRGLNPLALQDEPVKFAQNQNGPDEPLAAGE